jgi:ribonuclease HII
VNPLLNDSKKLTAKQRYALREQIEHEALAWAVGVATPEEIDNINILHASFLAMHRALDQLKLRPEAVIVDGNHFDPYVIGKGLPDEGKILPHTCIVKGDGKYLSIAAASILAKTYRDDYMTEQAERFPFYGWEKNKGYPTKTHYQGIEKHGLCALHRKSFNTHPSPSKERKHELNEGELVFK